MNCHCSFTQDVTEAQEGSQLDQKHPTVKQKKISLSSVGISENLKGDPTCIGPGMRSESSMATEWLKAAAQVSADLGLCSLG